MKRRPKFLTMQAMIYAKTDRKGCWLWQDYIDKTGYGRCSWRGNAFRAHQLSYIAFRGKIKKGMEIDHICRVRSCVNPDHLQMVTKKENILRGISFSAINKRKTHCSKGHEFEKVGSVKRKNGARDCYICYRENQKNCYEKNREKIAIRRKELRQKKAAYDKLKEGK